MENYKILPGIVLAEIHGVYVLIADKQGRKYCPYIRRINDVGAFIWKQLEKNKTTDEICELMAEEFEVPSVSELKSDINTFIESLKEYHYVI